MKKTSKLSINRQTLRALGASQLHVAVGGEPIRTGVADDSCICPSVGVTGCASCFSHRPGIC